MRKFDIIFHNPALVKSQLPPNIDKDYYGLSFIHHPYHALNHMIVIITTRYIRSNHGRWAVCVAYPWVLTTEMNFLTLMSVVPQHQDVHVPWSEFWATTYDDNMVNHIWFASPFLITYLDKHQSRSWRIIPNWKSLSLKIGEARNLPNLVNSLSPRTIGTTDIPAAAQQM